jgi:hypothetical protein
MKSPESKSNWSLRISVLSLTLSAFAFWYVSVKPADLKASLSDRLIFRWVTPKTPDPPGTMTERLTVLANVTFANNGAKMGEVQYFLLRLRDESDGTEWLLHPEMIVQESKVTMCWAELKATGETQSNLCREAYLSGFRSILLPGRQTTSQTYLCGYDPGFSKNVVLSPHRFRVTLYTLVSGENDLRPQEVGTLVITSKTIDAMKDNSVGVQFQEVKQSIRKTFPNTNQWTFDPFGDE